MPDTLADRLRALEDLRADVRTKLADALELAAGGGKGAKLSGEDAASHKRQLGLLAELEGWIRAGRPQLPLRARRNVQDGQSGVGPAYDDYDDPSDADRTPVSLAAAYSEDGERR